MKARAGWVGLVAATTVMAVGCGMDRQLAKSAPEDQTSPSVAGAPASELVARDAAAVGLQSSAGQPVKLPSQMIIRTGQVSIRVDSIEVAVRQVTDLASKAGGFVANSSMTSGENDARVATIELKIPADRYQGTVDGLKAVGKILSAATNSQDVGEEYVDITARITNAKKLEDRILNLLATRTGKLEDVLNVERELARVREEIERYEGRIRYLTSQVSMSTLTVTVSEPGPIVGGPGENVLVSAFRESWRNFVNVIAGGIALAGGLIPVLIFVVVVLLGLRWGLTRLRPTTPTDPPAA